MNRHPGPRANEFIEECNRLDLTHPLKNNISICRKRTPNEKL